MIRSCQKNEMKANSEVNHKKAQNHALISY